MNRLVCAVFGQTLYDHRNILEALTERVLVFIEDAYEVGMVKPTNSEREIRRGIRLNLPLEGEGIDSLLENIDDYLKYCIRTNRSEFMNPLWGGFSLPAFAGEVLSALAQTSMYTFEMAPLATLIEQTIISRMLEIVGFPDGVGTLTTGGSNGNMIGMLCARQRLNPAGLLRGFDGRSLAVFVSEDSHYSVSMSANVLGIGKQNIVKVRCDNAGRMNPDALRKEIEISLDEGKIPFCVIATSGTTVKGSFDPLRDISKIAYQFQLWLHVDAAWGGPCLFSAKHRHLMDGIELADSICWDAHKMMGVPLICSLFLTKHSKLMRAVCSHGDEAHYLFHPDSSDVDLGRISLQCGRRNDALKLWFAWKTIGDEGWARRVEGFMDLSSRLEQIIESDSEFEIMSERYWTNVCFRYKPDTSVDLNALNIHVRERLNENGEFMISRAMIDEKVVFRAVIANPEVDENVLLRLLDRIKEFGSEYIQMMNNIDIGNTNGK